MSVLSRISWRTLLLLALSLKLLLALLFSSGYSDALFRPFLQLFVSTGADPYGHFLAHPSGEAFPYPPLMLYLMGLPLWVLHLTGLESVALSNLFFKVPLLAADLLILWVLLRSFPHRRVAVLVFWFLSPLVLYSTYAHAQLDIIPTALFFVAVYALQQRRWLWAGLLLGLALATKLHLLAILPIIGIYLLRQQGWRRLLQVAGLAVLTWGLLSLPFSLRAHFWQYIFGDKQPQLLYSTFYRINDLKVYLPVLALLVLTFRFFNYRKANAELLYTYLALTLALFVTLITPSPAWYVWMMPFLVLFFVRYTPQDPRLAYLYLAFQAVYLCYFLAFHVGETYNLAWLGSPLPTPWVHDEKLHNLAFTLLLATMGAVLFAVYKLGLRSNQVYRKRHATVIGIGGDSGAGKSTLLQDVKAMLGYRMQELEGDADHRWERGDQNWKTYTHLDPKANQLHQQATQVQALKYGRAIFRREYDHHTGKFTRPARIQSRDFILLSGLHPFYLPQMRQLIDLKVYLDTDEPLRRHWKILRDTAKRGYTQAQILEQIEARMDDARKHIYPQKDYADLVISHFSTTPFTPGHPDAQPTLAQRFTFSTSLPAEPLLEVLYPLPLDWNYHPDLATQYILVPEEPTQLDVAALANALIPNVDELLGDAVVWQTGFRGLSQLVILYCLSHKMMQDG
jgi:uridine kinase/Gpi18-like mannosyltransferase